MARQRFSSRPRLGPVLVTVLAATTSSQALASTDRGGAPASDPAPPPAPPETAPPPAPAAPPKAAEPQDAAPGDTATPPPAAEGPADTTAAASPDSDAATDDATGAEGPAPEGPAPEGPAPAAEEKGDEPAADPFADPFASDDEDDSAGGASSTEDTSSSSGGDKLSMPKHSIAYTNLTVARLNPLGLENRLVMEYRYRLYDESSLLKDDSYISIGIDPLVSPAMARVGPSVFIKPLAILRLRFGYGVLAHFGNFQFLQSYDTPTAEHYTAEYRATVDNRYPALGWQGHFGALLQAKVGPIAIRNDLNFYRTDVNTKDNTGLFGEDPVFYYIRDDIMIAAHGWHMTNDTDLLYLSEFGLTAGVRTSVVKAFYPADVFLPGESKEDPNGPTVRMGPLLAYTFFDRPEEKKRFNKPTLLVMGQWWIKHRYRTGAAADIGESISLNPEGEKEPVGGLGDSLPAMPWFVLGFGFQGELFGRN